MNTSVVLSHKSEKNVSDFDKKSFMTVKEVASVLNVTPEAIKKHVRELFPEIIKNGVSIRLNEKQVTAIKQKMLPTTSVVGAVTDYEMELMTQKVLQYHMMKSAEYKARMEIAENALDRIANGKGCFSMGATAKKLHIKINGKELGRNNFIDFLKHENILMENGEPYQNQIQAEHFKTIITFINDKVGNKSVTLTTSKGIVYLAKKFNAEIDESVLSDYN